MWKSSKHIAQTLEMRIFLKYLSKDYKALIHEKSIYFVHEKCANYGKLLSFLYVEIKTT